MCAFMLNAESRFNLCSQDKGSLFPGGVQSVGVTRELGRAMTTLASAGGAVSECTALPGVFLRLL